VRGRGGGADAEALVGPGERALSRGTQHDDSNNNSSTATEHHWRAARAATPRHPLPRRENLRRREILTEALP
jgi:hypothetical protein